MPLGAATIGGVVTAGFVDDGGMAAAGGAMHPRSFFDDRYGIGIFNQVEKRFDEDDYGYNPRETGEIYAHPMHGAMICPHAILTYGSG